MGDWTKQPGRGAGICAWLQVRDQKSMIILWTILLLYVVLMIDLLVGELRGNRRVRKRY